MDVAPFTDPMPILLRSAIYLTGGKAAVQRAEEGWNYYPWRPYSASRQLRRQRAWCSAKNHHPREAEYGSWVWGYGFVCGRCNMPADPIPDARLARMAETLGDNPDQSAVAAVARWMAK